MTDYGTNNWPSSSLGATQHKKNKAHSFNEEHEKTYQALGSDKVVQSYSKNINKYRPRTYAKDPSTFAYYGKAEQYYKDSQSAILDYYPFDGSRSELLSWYHSASSLDVALLQQAWPTSVGHLNLNNSEYVLAYSGPESISEAEYVGNYKNEFNGLKIDLSEGMTVSFWLKKDSDPGAPLVEQIFDIGSYPGKLGATKQLHLGLRLRWAAALPVELVYSYGESGEDFLNISSLSDATIADASWHHFSLVVKQITPAVGDDYKLSVDLYFDGKYVATHSKDIALANFPNGIVKTNKFMACTLGTTLSSLSGSFSGSLDSFRVWQGQRTSKEINRYYDQKVFANEFDPEVSMSSTLGLNLTFNESPIGDTTKDKIALDYSGNDITGVIYNYRNTSKVNTSAIDLSNKSINTEVKDPVLNSLHPEIIKLNKELQDLGQSYDVENFNLLRNYLPDWTHSEIFGQESKEEMDFLLHLMATSFDSIRKNLESMRSLTRPEYEESSIQTDLLSDFTQEAQDQTIEGSLPASIASPTPAQNKIDFTKRVLSNYGFDAPEHDLFWTLSSQEVIESLIGNIRTGNTIEETKSLIFDCLANAAAFSLNKKGTRTAFKSVLNAAGLGEDLISYNLYGQNAQIKVEEKTEIISETLKSLNFKDNPSANIYSKNPISTAGNREFTFEGNFIFPSAPPGSEHTILSSSVFGLNHDAFTVTAEKPNYFSNNAKFVFKPTDVALSGAGFATLESEEFSDVYDSSPWHLAVVVFKSTDDKFFDNTKNNYKIGFYGHKTISGEIVQSFSLTQVLDQTKYDLFIARGKTPYIGAQRQNNNGTLVKSTDIKVLNFSAWDTALTKSELETNAATISSYGVGDYHSKDSFDLANADNRTRGEKHLFKIQFGALTKVSDSQTTVSDMIATSTYRTTALGARLGSSYDFHTFGFSTNLEESITPEFLPLVRKIFLPNLGSNQGIEIKDQEVDKFDLKTKPQTKVLSFEKSMYRVVSSEMLLFLSNLSNFNNLVGEPVNKYRKNYKALDSLRQKFFTIVQETAQVERFISYYRWIDKTVGHFLRQITPASLQVNSNIENVIESHLFERPKIQHKLTRIKNYSNLSDTIVSVMGFTAQSYSWSDGHHSDQENQNNTYDRQRSEVTADRQAIRNVINGSRNIPGTQFTNFQKFSQESLSKVYQESSLLDTIIKVGNNSDSSNSLDLDFYKMLSQELELHITQDSFEDLPGSEQGTRKPISVRVHEGSTSSGISSYARESLPFDFIADASADDASVVKSGIRIVNNAHRSEPLQGPWVSENVGFYPHRNVKVGTEAPNRPEAYMIISDESSNTLTVKKSSDHTPLVKRDSSSSVYNIRNVQTSALTGKIGNYANSYEVVQAVGADSINKAENKNLKEQIAASTFVEGIVDYPVVHGTGKNQKNVFISRFSASGGQGNFGKETSLGEMSVYNSMNYRNLLQRQVLNSLHSEASGPNGQRATLGSKGQIIGSFHKVPKNSTYRSTSGGNKVVNDNFFVQSHLPQTDFSYSWIKKAAAEDVYSFIAKNANAGHQNTFVLSSTGDSNSTIDFVKTSDQDPNLDMVGLNSVNSKTIDINSNTVVNSSGDLNTILLNNSGQFGWPSWKQIRNSYNPIVRSERKNNIISVTMRGDQSNARPHPGLNFDYKNTEEDKTSKSTSRTTKRFEEMPITSRFSPVKLVIMPDSEQETLEVENNFTPQQIEFFNWRSQTTDNYKMDYVGPKKIVISTSPQNSVTGFSNEELAEVLSYKERRLEETDSMQSMNYFIESVHRDPNLSLNNSKISYKEKIYPKEVNTFRQKVRKRANFDYFPWKSSRDLREITLQGNINYGSYFFSGINLLPAITITQQEAEYTKTFFNQYDAIDLDSSSSASSISSVDHIVSSTWPLDSRKDFTAFPCNITNTYFSSPSNFMASRTQGTRGEGILQNDYSLFPLGINLLHGAPPLAPVYNRRVPFVHSGATYLAGEAKWEANTGRTLGPFYDSYEKFSEQSQVIGKEYSLIPEFRVSKFVNRLLEQPDLDSLTVGLDDFLEIEGVNEGVTSSTESLNSQFFKTYSNTDFLKYFDLIHNNSVITDKGFEQETLTLRCKAIKKFLPYRGFYPAERVVELTNIFNQCYLKEGSYDSELLNTGLYASSNSEADTLLRARIQNSKTQALKPILAPGVIMNSIKAGTAVDYPIFNSNPTAALTVIYNDTDDADSALFSSLSSIASDTALPFKGTPINSSADSGIARINGTVSKRITFDDVMNPENLFSTIVHDNEPHVSATSLYGSNLHFSIFERPTTFGSLDRDKTIINCGIDFVNTKENFQDSIRPFKSAVNNFAAETVNFFLNDSKLTSLVSNAVKPKLKKGVQYKMFIHLKNKNIMMYDRHSAFGPAVDEGTLNVTNYSLSSNTSVATAATATIDFTGKTPGNLSDQTVTLVDHNNLSKTYIFKQDISSSSAVAATGRVQVDSLTLDGATFTLVDAESSPLTKTYEFETSAATAATAASTNITINTPSKPGGYNSNSNFAGETNYPYLEVTDEASSTHRIRFMNSISGSYMGNSASASNVSYVDFYNTSLSRYKTASELIADIKSEFESNLAVTVTEPSTAIMRITLNVTGAPSNATIASGNCFTNSSGGSCTAGNNVSEDSGLSAFSGGSAAVPASGTVSGGNVIININGMSTSGVLAEIKSVINTSAGHNNSIAVSVDNSNGRVELTQATAGTAGNNTINKGGSNSGNLTVTGFTGGTAAVSGTDYTTGQLLSSNIVVDVTSLSALSSLSSALVTAVTSSNGHNGTIIQDGSFNSSTDVLTLKQSTTGTAGNKTNSSTVSNFVGNFTGGVNQNTAQTLTEQTTSLQNSHGYLPYVPPFLDPGTSPYVEISFTPTETAEYTIPDIIDGCTKTFYNMAAPSNSSSNCNYTNAMNIEAALDLDKFLRMDEDAAGFYRWVIQTKWETPVLNFKNKSASAINLSSNAVESVSSSPWKPRTQDNYYKVNNTSTHLPASRGMWHQFGDTIQENSRDGYLLSVSGTPETSSVKDLSKILGFAPSHSKGTENFSERRLGKIPETKQVCEAVVAIPYYLNEKGQMRLFETKGGSPASSVYGSANSGTGAGSMSRQIEMMNKYVIPPQFDFTRNKKVNPHVQYIFEFKMDLSRQDLSDIWQNLYPENSTNAVKTKKSNTFPETDTQISKDHEFVVTNINPMNSDLFANAELIKTEKIRWIVFKAKYRGLHKLSVLKRRSAAPEGNISESNIGSDDKTGNDVTDYIYDNYGFNWPYDYFSIVELVQLSAKVDFAIPSTATTSAAYSTDKDLNSETPPVVIPPVDDQVETPPVQQSAVTVEVSQSSSDSGFSSTTFTQTLKQVDAAVPSPANQVTVPIPTGYSLKVGSVSIYLNGVLQTEGSSNDYTLSSGVITTSEDLTVSDGLTIKYRLLEDT